ncbi:MAG: fibronectin type III domain-containing protein [Spirochaetes bacterium]|nr:fibronectin type III domain-containing protein [Spirochaetota bacterium]
MKKFNVFVLLSLLAGILFVSCDGGGSTGSTNTTPTPLPPALEVTAITIGQTQVAINWQDPVDADFVKVKISCSNGDSEYFTGVQTGSISGLTTNTEYTFTINAVYNGDILSEDVTLTLKTTSTSATVTPILINSAAGLNDVHNNLAGKYMLISDVDMEGIAWTPIGNNPNYFTGTFNGAGHVISNFKIDGTVDGQGFFSFTSTTSVIENLGLENIEVKSTNNFSAGLVGRNNGKITNCYVSGSVTSTGTYGTGGIAGYNLGAITNCHAVVSVNGKERTGGLVGYNQTVTISNCYVSGSVIGTDNTGGLLGLGDGANIISNCYAICSVTGLNNTGGPYMPA